MTEHNASSALLLVAAFSRHPAALDWTRETPSAAWGPIALESSRFDFAETDYYTPAMGAGLRKTFFACEPLFDPARLADCKLAAGEWECQYARQAAHPEPRPLNLDPGYLTEGKLVLASTKEHCHRIYLRDGIYAEVTLYFQRGRWQNSAWTYPDYQREDFQAFFTQCRDYVKMRRKAGR